jgi:hypothetical protein
LIDVGVRRRIAFEQIACVADDLHRGRGAEGQRQVQGDRHAGTNVHVAVKSLEALRFNGDVVRIRRKIAEDIPPRRVGRHHPRESRNRIADPDLNGLHHAARRILHCPLDGASAAETLCAGQRRDQQRQHGDCDADTGASVQHSQRAGKSPHGEPR